jgi:ABC-2 type transport system permease protein
VYYYDSIPDKSMYKYNPGMSLRALAERYSKTSKVDLDRFKTPAEIRRLIDLRPEDNRYVMQLKYKGKNTFLRLFDDPIVFPTETETSAALKRMMGALPKIAFLQGELERSIDKIGDRDYMTLTSQKTFRYALVNQGFDVETISLKDSSVPSDITGLVIADPRTNFDTAVLVRLQQYIDKGGNLLIAGEPGKQVILNPLLQKLGVQLMDGVIVQPSKQYAPDLVLPYLTDAAGGLSTALPVKAEDSARISMPGVAGLAYPGKAAGSTFNGNGGFTVSTLAVTDGKLSWNKKGRLVTDSADVVYSPGEGDEKGAFPLALRLTRMVSGREQRIVVAGDADFLSNVELSRRNVRTANFSFNTAVFGWFSYGAFPIDSSRPKSRDTHINLTDKGLAILKVLFLGVLPGLLLIFGAVLLIRRKRK